MEIKIRQHEIQDITLGDKALVFLTGLQFLLATIGDRVGDAGISSSLFRGLHFSDLLTPIFVLCVILLLPKITRIIGTSVKFAVFGWLAYCFTFGILGPFFISTGTNVPLGVGLLFAGKELQFLSFFLLCVYVANKVPLTAIRFLNWVGLLLVVWLFKEMIDPTGYYLVGLPFEKGASQTGAVYALLGVAMFYIQTLAKTTLTRRIILFILGIALVIGSILSLSRSAVLGLGIAYFVGMVRSLRQFRIAVLILLLMWLSFVLLADTGFVGSSDFIFDRWADVNEHAGYRISKWNDLVGFILDHPVSLLIGAGLGTPNYLVLGPELGVMLAVDSGYVRRLFEVGIFGSVFYILVFLTLWNRARKLQVGTAIFGLICVIGGTSITLEAFQVSQTALLFFGLCGIYIGVATNKRDTDRHWMEERKQG